MRVKHTSQHNKQVQSSALFETHASVASRGQIWCICCDVYYITETYEGEWQPECWVNFCLMFLRKMTFCWAIAAWKLSLLRQLPCECFKARFLLRWMNKTSLCFRRKKMCCFKSNIAGFCSHYQWPGRILYVPTPLLVDVFIVHRLSKNKYI